MVRPQSDCSFFPKIFLQTKIFWGYPFFSKRFIYSFVISTKRYIFICHFDQALARGEISLFVARYFIYRDFSTTLEMTKEKSKPKYNRLAFIMLLLTPEKILHSKRFLGKRRSLLSAVLFAIANC